LKPKRSGTVWCGCGGGQADSSALIASEPGSDLLSPQGHTAAPY